MHVTLVQVHVKQEHIADFIAACRANHQASVREPGNLRFDILQDDADRSRFVLYEAYRTAADTAAHKNTTHYLRWRELVALWMAEDRSAMRYTGLFPEAP